MATLHHDPMRRVAASADLPQFGRAVTPADGEAAAQPASARHSGALIVKPTSAPHVLR
jgi:hypothetical protein